MNKSPALLAAAMLLVALTGCSTAGGKAPAQISKPGADITQQSQPFQHDPVCLRRPCPR